MVFITSSPQLQRVATHWQLYFIPQMAALKWLPKWFWDTETCILYSALGSLVFYCFQLKNPFYYSMCCCCISTWGKKSPLNGQFPLKTESIPISREWMFYIKMSCRLHRYRKPMPMPCAVVWAVLHMTANGAVMYCRTQTGVTCSPHAWSVLQTEGTEFLRALKAHLRDTRLSLFLILGDAKEP